MLIEEEEAKTSTEINPDAIEGILEEDSIEEDELVMFRTLEEEEEVDIAFDSNPEGYW